MAGTVIDLLSEELRSRVSITRAYNSSIPEQSWDKRFTLEIVPSTLYCVEDLADTVDALPEVANLFITTHKEPRIQITGEYL